MKTLPSALQALARKLTDPETRGWLFKEREILETSLYVTAALSLVLLVRSLVSPSNQDTVSSIFTITAILIFAAYLLGFIKPYVISRIYPLLLRPGDAIHYRDDKIPKDVTMQIEGQILSLRRNPESPKYYNEYFVDVVSNGETHSILIDTVLEVVSPAQAQPIGQNVK